MKVKKYFSEIWEMLRGVVAEFRLVVWPSPKEVAIVSGLVVVMLLVSSIFFLFCDYAVYKVVSQVIEGGR